MEPPAIEQRSGMVFGRRSAWSRLREGPEWSRTPEDRGCRKRTEIAAVEGIGGLPVHEEDLALRNHAAALPNGQRPATVISLASERHHDAIDHDGETDAADGLTGKGNHLLQERHAERQIVPLRQKPRDLLGRRDDDEIRHRQMILRLHMIKTDWYARRSIPDQYRWPIDCRWNACKHHASEHCAENEDARVHPSTFRRRSQA